MKKTTQFLSTLALILFLLPFGQAQESNSVRQPGYWTFGINGGWAYQQSDVPIDWKGWGLGATLAKNLYYKPGAIFSFDARGRFLYDRTYGLDHAQSFGINNNEALNGNRGDNIDYTEQNGGPGFVYQNHYTEKGELALEGVLHFNRLREKTNINLALFGGIGLDLYKTKIDQRDADGLYDTDYLSLNPRDPVSLKKSFLRDNILDGKYETDAQGFENTAKVGFMPELGIELGYQFTPRFSMGVGHKITFSQTDLLDGQKWKNDDLATSNNDLHHYTNLHMRWIIDAGTRRKMQSPIIQMIRPTNNPFTTRESYGDIGAKILHVKSAMDITCTVNGRSVPFNFQREYFSLFQDLRPGRNEVIITATNSAGRDQERLTIIYEESIIDTPPPPDTRATPRVNITNPSQRSITTGNEYFDFNADIDNVSRKQDLTLTIDGQRITNFDFDASRGFLRANIRLKKGRNYVQLKASTRGGNDEDDAIITYDKRAEESQRRPEVRITSPSGNPYRTQRERLTIEADIREVRDKRDITVRLNGRSLRDFNFDGRVVRADLYLQVGENTLEVEAENKAGRDRDSKTLILDQRYDPPKTENAPVVNFVRPSQRNSSSSNQRYDIRATVRNISNKNDIRFYHNGRRITNFNFRNETLTHNITLQNGNNTVSIEASNRAGKDKEEVYINYSRITTPSNPPQVSITRPTSSSSATPAINLQAKVLNVSSKSGISLTLNGRTVNKFSFNTSTKILTASLTLNTGNNTIIVKAQNQDGQDEASKVISYRKSSNPPQVSISRPVATTSSTPNVSLAAKVLNVSSKGNITITLNGKAVNNFAFNTKSKMVSSSLLLQKGRNTIVVKASNKDGQDQDNKTITYNVSSNPPQVTITKPTARTTATANQNVQAKILNVSSKNDITLLLNGNRISNFNFNTSTKIMSATISLNPGTNNIIVKGKNADGQDQDSKSITYNKATNPPQVSIVRPTAKSTTSSNVNVQAKVLNVNSKNDITMTLNGANTSAFNFNTSTKVLTAQVTLRKGNNSIVVKARNSDGSDQDSKSITYAVASNPPIVTITSPRSKAQLKSTSTVVKATIKNVRSKNNVQFQINGRSVSNFTFSGTSFSGTANLKKGQNTIKITASNSDGRDDASVVVYADPPVILAKPVVKFINPARPNTKVSSTKFSVKVSVKNVTSKSQISFKVNGKTNGKFNFDTRTGILTSTLVLASGLTNLEVIATNTSGRAKATSSVNAGGVVIGTPGSRKPTITFVSISEPVVDPFNPDVGNSAFIAKTTNVSSKNQITFYINGQTSTNFNFNTKTKTISANASLKRGSNTLILEVKTEGGSARLEKTIVF